MVSVFETNSEEEVCDLLEGLPLSGVATPHLRRMRALGEMHALGEP